MLAIVWTGWSIDCARSDLEETGPTERLAAPLGRDELGWQASGKHPRQTDVESVYSRMNAEPRLLSGAPIDPVACMPLESRSDVKSVKLKLCVGEIEKKRNDLTFEIMITF